MMSTLILKRASVSRPSGEWNDDDYDVLALAAEFIALHLTSPRCSLQLMDMSPGAQLNFPPRARQRVQALAADQLQ
jgi:hypothetical protein